MLGCSAVRTGKVFLPLTAFIIKIVAVRSFHFLELLYIHNALHHITRPSLVKPIAQNLLQYLLRRSFIQILEFRVQLCIMLEAQPRAHEYTFPTSPLLGAFFPRFSLVPRLSSVL
jgi:hypothetical protein